MNCIRSFEEVGGICKSLLLQQVRDLCNFQLLNMVGLIFERGDCIISLHNSSEGAGVKVGRNGPERRSDCGGPGRAKISVFDTEKINKKDPQEFSFERWRGLLRKSWEPLERSTKSGVLLLFSVPGLKHFFF